MMTVQGLSKTRRWPFYRLERESAALVLVFRPDFRISTLTADCTWIKRKFLVMKIAQTDASSKELRKSLTREGRKIEIIPHNRL